MISIFILIVCVMSFVLGYEMGRRDHTDFWNSGGIT